MPSSVIQIMFYDPNARILDVVYRLGWGTYRYFEVAPEEWETFRTALSKGTYLNEAFKARHTHYAKLKKGEGMSRETTGVEFWPHSGE